MRILLVGASGTLGRAIALELAARHEAIGAGRTSAQVRLDLTDVASIRRALDQVGELDAVIGAAGRVTFAPLADFQAAPYGESLHTLGVTDKLFGQVNLALAARDHLRDGRSITLTSGILAEQPIRQGTSASLVNGAIDAFARAAAIELPRGSRINVVSPTVLSEAMGDYAPYFRGFEPVPAARAALAFCRSVEGAESGKTYRVF
ncbi:MAG: short chain dehydrogenase [Dokdonella sp.]